MQLLRVFLFTFGGLFLLGLIALVRQLGNEHFSVEERPKTLRGSIEGWFLFGAALVLGVRYLADLARAAMMPGIATEWLVAYGTCCAFYLAVKAIRSLRIRG